MIILHYECISAASENTVNTNGAVGGKKLVLQSTLYFIILINFLRMQAMILLELYFNFFKKNPVKRVLAKT